jgi:hypothetical protein
MAEKILLKLTSHDFLELPIAYKVQILYTGMFDLPGTGHGLHFQLFPILSFHVKLHFSKGAV